MTIRSELTPRVRDMAATLNVPVAYENVNFTKPSSGAFLEMFIVPTTTKDVTVDGTRQRELGYMQLNVWCPVGKGTKQSDDIVEAIKLAFPLVPKTGNVSIENTASIKQAIVDESGYRIIPVVIPYRLEVQS